MIFRRPPSKRYHLQNQDITAMDTVLLHLSPYGVGRIGGEMARRMVDAAQSYLEEVTAQEIRRAFQSEILGSAETAGKTTSAKDQKKARSFSPVNDAAGEAPANQYPSGNESH